jgi:hypothetical protein
MEKWKDIPGYEGIYEASTFGRIRTKDGKTTFTERHGIRLWKSRILKYRGSNKVTGNRVSLWKGGECKDWLVARLIAYTFLGIPEIKLTVNHKDGNRFNNKIENLEWLSLADNIRHGFDNGLYPMMSVSLFEKSTLNTLKFKSKSDASRFLNRNVGYICGCIKKGRLDIGNYIILKG